MKKLLHSKFWWVVVLAILLLANYIASLLHFRVDLTEENRYTLSAPTKRILRQLPDVVSVTVFLEGEMPAGFRKLANSTRELLDEFKEYGTTNVRVKFMKPGGAAGDSSAGLTMDSLMKLGLKPTNVRVQAKEGEGEEQRYLFPGALVEYRDRILPVDFLQGQNMEGGINSLNNAEALLEYKLMSAIQKISTDSIPLVGYLTGNGEPLTYNFFDLIERTLKVNYRFSFFPIDSEAAIPSAFDAMLIVKPVNPFTDQQKLKLDQYIMNGGKVIWLIDRLYAEMDSLMRTQSDFVAFDRNLNLDDLLFKYGVRINADLLQDLQCDKLPLVVGNFGDQPQMQLTSWPYFPLLSSYSNHPISKNLDNVLTLFPNSIDTIKSTGVNKTVLLASSDGSRILNTPAIVSLNSIKTEEDLKTFNKRQVPVAVLLEGRFTSLYANRFSKSVTDSLSKIYNKPFLPASAASNKMVVVSDADVVYNVFTQNEGPAEMGFNQFTKSQYANRDFIMNCIEYLVNPSGILETRSKDFTLRLLDTKKLDEGRTRWQLINIALPIVLVLIFGMIYQALRKKKYQQ